MNTATSLRHEAIGHSNRPIACRASAEKASYSSERRNRSHRSQSTPPHNQAVLMHCWMDDASTSLEEASPALANTSPSPVVSTTTRALMANRPPLPSNTTPRSRPSSTMEAEAHTWNSSSTPASRTAANDTAFSCSGSIIGAQVTVSWWAEKRGFQCATASASCEPQAEGSGPTLASAGSRSISSSPNPRMTSLPSQSVMRSIQITNPPVESPPRWL